MPGFPHTILVGGFKKSGGPPGPWGIGVTPDLGSVS